ncbi:hypothetical protein Pint_31064 [Pistacia integerrima]|uniref:Uncharacterized protein n=1 Tax=Pistacia integerrima TaxID=434235 RepID=A0ACC0XP48_9ROSI|nr:hypothetical protein Pint_31064 [Pistacia integerrima]
MGSSNFIHLKIGFPYGWREDADNHAHEAGASIPSVFCLTSQF